MGRSARTLTTVLYSLFLTCFVTMGAAHAAERRMSVSTFEDIRLEGVISVEITTGKSPSAKASGDARTLDRLSFRRSGRTLIVSLRRRSSGTGTIESSDNVTLKLSTFQVRSVAVIGAGDIKLDRLKGSKTKVLLNGVGEIRVGDIETTDLKLLSFGSGHIEIAGKSLTTKIEMQGVTSLSGAGFETRSLKLTHRGPAKSHLRVSERAEITNSGTGAITIDGLPTCFVKSAGSARIICDKKKRWR